MAFDPETQHRRSIRLRGYDYSQPGVYFATVCAHGKQHLFGEMVEGEMVANEAAQLVRRAWQNLPRRFPSILLDEFIVMPNHVHGIIEIVAAGFVPPGGNPVGAGLALPSGVIPGKMPRGAVRHPTDASTENGAGAASSAPTLGDVVRAFKSTSAIAVNALIGRSEKPLWQRNYYEHVVRGARELEIIREYIRTNPVRWATDPENFLSP